jgi:hypothetical protein
MAIHAPRRGATAAGSPQSAEATTLPAPTGGVDARQNLSQADVDTCVYAYNVNAAEYGLELRDGYREWVVGLDSDVRTLIPFTGEVADRTDDRLFALTQSGIYDVTTEGQPPVLKFAFPNVTANAGYGVYTQYTTDAGANIVYYADQANGLHTYTPSTDTWALATGITGVSITGINYVVVHKQRVWFGTVNTATAYYLGIGSIAGAVTPFYFGGKFKHGGDLVGLFNWTVATGSGLDDQLVVVSRGGDVMPYIGTDPEVDWNSVGTYYIGEVPVGNKIGSQFGGDLHLLSVFGLTAMSDLLRGVEVKDTAAESLAYKVAKLLRADIAASQNRQGWEIRYLPNQGIFLINTPRTAGGDDFQYVLNSTTDGWSFWRGVPMNCVEPWQGAAMLGTLDGRILRMDAPRDNILLNDSESGTDVEFSILFNPSSLGTKAQFKRVELLRPTFLSQIQPIYTTKVLYDYSLGEAGAPSGFTTSAKALWDIAKWDLAVWDSSTLESFSGLRGASGIGRTISVALRGRGAAHSILIDIDVVWRAGGIL